MALRQYLSCSQSAQGIDCFQALLFSKGTLSDYTESKWRGRVKSIAAVHDGTLCQCAGTLWEERSPSPSSQMPKCTTAPFQGDVGFQRKENEDSGMEKCKLCLLETPTQNKTWRGLSSPLLWYYHLSGKRMYTKINDNNLNPASLTFPKHVTSRNQRIFRASFLARCKEKERKKRILPAGPTYWLQRANNNQAKGKAHRYCGQIMIPGPSEIWERYITRSFRIQ